MEEKADCVLVDDACVSCNAGFHLEYWQDFRCPDGSHLYVDWGCGSC